MREKGFFLIDTVILGAVLIAAASVSYLFNAASRQQLNNEAAIAAAFLGQEQIARIEAKPINELSIMSTAAWQGNGTNPVVLNGKEFYIDTTLEAVEGGRFRLVNVKVSWTEDAKTVTQTYRKLVACYE